MSRSPRGRAAALAMLLVAVLTILPEPAAAATDLAPLHVDGAHLVDMDGRTVVLHGVDRIGTEYMCAQDRGIIDGPIDQAAIAAIRSWGANAVRIPLNEHCWLGVDDGAPTPDLVSESYRQTVADVVALLIANGLYPILDLHWSAPEGEPANGQRPMPNTSYSAAFWASVGARFGGDARVIFDLFNEPVPNNNAADTDEDSARRSWECWRDGGASCDATLDLGSESTRMTSAQALGMRALVDAVRAAGATNVILLGGIQWSNTLSSDAAHNWLAYRPDDPLGDVAASVHLYPEGWCTDADCFEREIAPVAAAVPVVTTEFGYDDCGDVAATWLESLMSWMDQRSIGYVAWSWFVPYNEADACAGRRLVASFDGAATAYGRIYQAHLAGLPVDTNVDLATSAARVVEGDAVTLAAQVLSRDSPRIPTESVVFAIDGADAASVELDGSGHAMHTMTFADEGAHAVVARYTGASGFHPSASAAVSLTIDNAAPQVDALVAPEGDVPVGTEVTVRATFHDRGTTDTHTAVFDWGDGSSGAATIAEADGSGEAAASHTYATPGMYRLVATVTDDDAASGTSTLESLVVDPNASAAGNGWVDARSGAYTASGTWSGRAAFGFDASYVKGASAPTGKTLFSLRGAPLSFESTSYDWLAVAGGRVYLQGAGRLNGTDGYAFLIAAVDGDRAGDVDRLRVRIWVRATGEVIYDDQPGASQGAAAATAIGGGSIAARSRARQ